MINTEGLTGRVILKSSPGYDEARQNYNGRFNKFPWAIVYCQSEQDVINAILWVRKHQLPFRIRCGGHSYEAFSLVDGGLVIDVKELLDLQIDKENLTVRVGAGLRPSQLYETLWNQRLTIPGGTCPTVGISGVTLGGGYGYLSRLLGMLCDSVLEIEMVNAQGSVLRANDSQHSDLYWACRGGGDGSYGVITSFTFRLHPISNVARYRMTWDFSDLKKVVKYWQDWAPHTDVRLTSSLALPAKNQGDLRSNGVFTGPVQELRQIVGPLQESTRPKTAEFHYTTWMEAVRFFAGEPLKQEKFKNSSAYAGEPLPDAALDILIHNLKIAPGPVNVVSFDAYGGAISRIPAGATAFPHRNALFGLQYQSYWYEDANADDNIKWIEQFRTSMLPYTRGAYRNYCDSMIIDWPAAYFGKNLEKLKEVKRRYDPENLFYFEQSIPI